MKQSKERGFTLIELMITVAILGIIAAIAIPTFGSFVARSKTAEAGANLNLLFKAAASYYSDERTGQSMTSSTSGHCTIGMVGPQPATPGRQKSKFVPDDKFKALGFTIADFVYFSYGVRNAVSVCGNPPNSADLYTFYANADLDGDGVMSTFELAAGSDSSNVLYHGRAIFIDKEDE